MSNDTTKARPTHRVYAVTKKDNAKPFWLKIGAAWPNKDGKGFNIKFDTCPWGNAEIVMRKVKEKVEEAASEAA